MVSSPSADTVPASSCCTFYLKTQTVGHPCIGRFSFICADHDTKISRQVSPMVKLGGGWSG